MHLSINEVGIPTARDFNMGTLNGDQYARATINPKGDTCRGSRASLLASEALHPNLVVLRGALAKNIIFDNNSSTPKATSVHFSSPFGVKMGTAKHKVIVSTGAFQSPQLSIVSGISPREQFTAKGIPVLIESTNVGQNMQSHIFVGLSYEVDGSLNTFTYAASDLVYLPRKFQFLLSTSPVPSRLRRIEFHSLFRSFHDDIKLLAHPLTRLPTCSFGCTTPTGPFSIGASILPALPALH
ncbi:GMC oxidoreductase [Tilletiaria anomala UBC 951]|uniref:GMC oxidoreductase n=1 Tax=Tilletiaria anomala (strain ATCC 24038 / CBS 436.72 / UBC 951) TaxID=1037660 RepID=A0A066V2X3_TILAU|nr:GMC oxidoreductase [Tilletiaria anomala UBC 951]KDN35781.1 GMC oxidoreductase [Tilletiaria anomala UBC 951]